MISLSFIYIDIIVNLLFLSRYHNDYCIIRVFSRVIPRVISRITSFSLIIIIFIILKNSSAIIISF